MLVRRRNPCEVGWFGSKLVKRVGKIATGAVKVVSKVPGVSVVTAPVRLATDVARGRNVVRSIGRAGSSVVADARKSLPIAAGVVSFVPGVGTGVAAGLSAANAISQGKSLTEIAKEAAIGAVPGGQLIRAGVNAGVGVARGQNVLKTVVREGVSYARAQVPGGQLAQSAINVVNDAARGRNVVRAVVREGTSVARANLPGGQLVERAVNAGSAIASGRNVVRAVGNEAVSAATSAVKGQLMPFQRPNFGQPVSVSPELGSRARSIINGARPNMGKPRISLTNAKASFRPLSRNTHGWLTRALPHLRSEVSGLSETGAQWIVQKGDTGSGIALKLTGSAARWTELRAVNPVVMGRGADLIKKYGFPIYVGDKVNLPSSWIKPTTSAPAQSTSTPTAAKPPAVEIPGGDLAAQGQARVILAAWGKSDGSNEAGVPDYGNQNELQATAWSSRDAMQGESFAGWWRRFGGAPSVDGGQWSDNLAQALNRWAEKKANTVQNSAIAAGGVVIPTIVQPPAPTPAPSPAAQVPASPATSPATTATTPQLPQILPPGVTLSLPAPTSQPIATTSATEPAPAPASGFTDAQKWGFGTTAASVAAAAIIKALWA
jgi:hypothetical protein